MIGPGERVFIDTGAWIALAEKRDSLHERAVAEWQAIERAGARLFTSVPVVIETFTFLDRRGSRELALRWKASLAGLRRFEVLGVNRADLEEAWALFERKELLKLSLVDATSFALMRRNRIKFAFAFDVHFSLAGFRYVS